VSVRIKNLLYIVIPFFALLFIFISLINFYKNNQIKTILDTHSNKIETYYGILSYNQQKTADVTYEETMQNDQLISIIADANIAKTNNDTKKLDTLRDDAKKLLESKYKLYQQKGILQYHFVFPDNTVFLRMHKPSKYGDNLTSVRKDFAYTNKTLKKVRGFAQGRTAHAFRNVYPLIDQNNKHLGAFEVSFSSELLQNYFTKVNKIHTHFLVRKDIFDSHTWKRDDLIIKYQPSSEDENYMITMTDNHTIAKCIMENSKRIKPNKKEIEKNIAKKEKFSVYTIFEKKARVTSFFPILHNINKEPVAWIVSYITEPLIDETIETAFILYILVFIILFILFIFIYFIFNQKEILNKIVEEKTHYLNEVNNELESSKEQLQLINEELEYRISEEVDKNRQKDKILFEQTKMAALGEMIGNVAHQWRQPLSVISTTASGMQLQNEMDMLDKDKINQYCIKINESSQYLSKTIDNFRDFIKGQSKKGKFNLFDSFSLFLELVKTTKDDHNIDIVLDIPKELEIVGFKNELNQVFVNLFNNSTDIFVQNDIENKVVLIKGEKENNQIVISFYDNGLGIDETIIDKVFEPYFTTKHQSLGKGLGLNMAYKLIVGVMKGDIYVSNEKFKVGDLEYFGAKFTITLDMQ